MKNLIFIFTLIFSMGFAQNSLAQADAISKYFSKYMDDERFTVVYVSGKMFEFFQQATEDLEEAEVKAIRDVVTDMKGLRILTTDQNAGEFYKEAAAIINKNEYEVLMTVREGKSEHVQFLAKDDANGKIFELLLLVGEEASEDDDGEFVLMSFIGEINLKELSKLEKAFENSDIHINENSKQ